MNTNSIFLIVAALIPALSLLIFIFKKDKVEKEPIFLLLLLLASGVIICYPAAKIERFILDFINICFQPFMKEVDGQIFLSERTFKVYTAAQNFIGIALVEEMLKFLVLIIFTKKSKNFNCLFDGIVYSVFVSLGFAGFENILYVLQYGWGNALIRALTAVPGHMFFAVIMGYYYSWAHIFEKAKQYEIKWKKDGIIPENIIEFSAKKYWICSILIPVLAHGFYDYCCSMDTLFATIAFYVFIIILYVLCFKKVNKMSKADAVDSTYTIYLLLKKYPQLNEFLFNNIQSYNSCE